MKNGEIGDLELWVVARLGRQLLKRERHGQARSLFRGLVSMRPSYGYAWHMLGVVHRRNHHSNRAVECFRRHLEIDSDALTSRIALAETLDGMDRRGEAIEALSPVSTRKTIPGEEAQMRRATALLERWTTS